MNLPPHNFVGFRICQEEEGVEAILTFENAHVPISVSVGDTLEREPTPFYERDLRN